MKQGCFLAKGRVSSSPLRHKRRLVGVGRAELPSSVAVEQSVDTLVGPGGASTWEMKTDATFWQSKDALYLPLACRDARVPPQIKLAPGWELFLRGLSFSFHGEIFVILLQSIGYWSVTASGGQTQPFFVLLEGL